MLDKSKAFDEQNASLIGDSGIARGICLGYSGRVARCACGAAADAGTLLPLSAAEIGPVKSAPAFAAFACYSLGTRDKTSVITGEPLCPADQPTWQQQKLSLLPCQVSMLAVGLEPAQPPMMWNPGRAKSASMS